MRHPPGVRAPVAERAGEVVGYCHGMKHEGSESLVNSLVVRKDMRRAGLGSALLAASSASGSNASFI